MLNAQINRQDQRLAQAVFIFQAGVVIQFRTRKATPIGVDKAKHMRRQVTMRVDALFFLLEREARHAQGIHLPRLVRGELTLDPHKPAIAGQARAQFFGIHIGENRQQLLDRFIHIQNAFGVGVKG